MLSIDFIDPKIRLAKGQENLSFDIAAGNINFDRDQPDRFTISFCE